MRLSFIGFVAFAAILGAASPAAAASGSPNELVLNASKVTTYAPLNENGGSIPNVTRGQPLAIACTEVHKPSADVRVVMQVTNITGETSPGYEAVLATDQKIERGMVHVRVPDVPGLAQHTVNIRVFVVDRMGTHRCDAGRVRIV